MYTVGVSEAPTTSGMAVGVGWLSSSMGASMPAARNSSPSSTRATASQAAPPSNAARATGTAP